MPGRGRGKRGRGSAKTAKSKAAPKKKAAQTPIKEEAELQTTCDDIEEPPLKKAKTDDGTDKIAKEEPKAKAAKSKAAPKKKAAQTPIKEEAEPDAIDDIEEPPLKKAKTDKKSAPKKETAVKAKAAKSKAAPKKKAAQTPIKEEKEPQTTNDDTEEPPPTTDEKSDVTDKKAKEEPKKERATGPRVDTNVPGRDSFKVVQDFNATLNQTNIHGNLNNNKFYIVQLLTNDSDEFYTWNRWGRVGVDGQTSLTKFGSDFTKACVDFRKKFSAKTGNTWDNRDNFVKKSGKYGLVEVEDVDGDDEGASALGKLSESQIKKGQEVLKKLKEIVGKSGEVSDEIARLSGDYYSLIPTVHGMKKLPPLNTIELIDEKEHLLEFYLRMGFEDLGNVSDDLAPLDGLMEQVCSKSLEAAALSITNKQAIGSSKSRASVCAKTVSAENPSTDVPLTELFAAILLYTGSAIYGELNAKLRSEDRKKLKKYYPYLRLFFEAVTTLPTKAKNVYRGVGLDLQKEYSIGKVITWWGVSSCTASFPVAQGFAGGCGNNATLFTVEAKSGCDVSKLSFYPHEQETLLPPGTQLRVVSCKKEAGRYTEITLEEVGNVVRDK